ncbi:RUS family member 1 isoform X1 [Sitodiplosis mosellana]|uniref:RUS family member 1 isoform X1 n=1 Tax=Sitodiplosis mosellana TaxID=263140 RepID=UPI00244513B4|nr:RUS family member 1 isoform X1 [Sitodiplosis mosellana]
MRVHFREKYGTKGEEILYVTPADQESIVRVPLTRVSVDEKPLISENFALYRIFKNLFLPQGYPDSVSEDYIHYQFWDTVQAFCSTINGTLSTHAILKGVGVGSDIVNPISATVAWVLKDGAGHFGKILFAWWKGSQLDIDSKKWRIRADILNDVAMAIEILVLPRYENYTTHIFCATTSMKAIVGVAGGATRFALTQHHAIRGNLADVASKDNSQETAVNLIASFVGLYLLSAVISHTVLLSIFFFSIVMHIVANIRAVEAVRLRTFNESRYLIALEEYFRSGKVLSVESVNSLERVTIGRMVSVSLPIRVGLSIQHLIEQIRSTPEIENIIMQFDKTNEKFLIAEGKKFIGIYLHVDARPQDVLKAYFYAMSHLQDRTTLRERGWEVQSKWNEFITMAQRENWATLVHLICVDEYRIEWKM